MDSVTHFEIPFESQKRAMEFYRKTFGWEMNPLPEMEYTMVHTTETDKQTRMIKKPGAINGGMMKRSGKIKSPVITIVVKNMEESLKAVKANGGSIHQDKTAVGDMGFAAYIKDSEGNVMGLFQPTKM
jgi:uncharacterized protein